MIDFFWISKAVRNSFNQIGYILFIPNTKHAAPNCKMERMNRNILNSFVLHSQRIWHFSLTLRLQIWKGKAPVAEIKKRFGTKISATIGRELVKIYHTHDNIIGRVADDEGE